MMRKSAIAAAAALLLASSSALAAPSRVAAPVSETEGLNENSAWILPAVAVVIVALIVLLDDDGDSDRPTSP